VPSAPKVENNPFAKVAPYWMETMAPISAPIGTVGAPDPPSRSFAKETILSCPLMSTGCSIDRNWL
jgi:hypothetical protein